MKIFEQPKIEITAADEDANLGGTDCRFIFYGYYYLFKQALETSKRTQPQVSGDKVSYFKKRCAACLNSFKQ